MIAVVYLLALQVIGIIHLTSYIIYLTSYIFYARRVRLL